MMKMSNLGKIKTEKNDKGSTLITVIVAIAFVTILTSIILGTTAVNVRMKGIDKITRDDFYYAEKALNDIYTGIGQKLATMAGEEYEAAFEKIGTSEAYSQAEAAEKEFRTNFISKAAIFVQTLDKDTLKKYITSSDRNETVESVGTILYQKIDGSKATADTAERIVLPNVVISASERSDQSGYSSAITTDIVINIPTVDFLGTNADISDYGLIANKGLYIKGTNTADTRTPADSTTKITGNVYAGVHKTSAGDDALFEEKTDKYSRKDVYGGINIYSTKAEFDGNYIISKGDINLAGNNPELHVHSSSVAEVAEGAVADSNLPNLWCTSLRTISGQDGSKTSIKDEPVAPMANPLIDINANMFTLNDLILNADKSSARIAGNYYGYNDMALPVGQLLGARTYTEGGELKSKRVDSESSSIIINGSKAYLDMSDIRNFVLMGKAYIDFTSDDDTQGDAMAADNTKQEVVPTAEGVALKTNQQAYLVPTDFLKQPNPLLDTVDSDFEFAISETDYKNWFGFKYLKYKDEGGTESIENTHKKYDVTQTSGLVHYDYLVFNDYIWMPIIEGGKITGYEDTPDTSGAELGTGGSISSKQKFFYEIMTAEKEYKKKYDAEPQSVRDSMQFKQYVEEKESDPDIIQPSAYRIYDRIRRSMGYSYFDLRACVIGDGSDEAHYYSKNAVINYKKDSDPEIGFQSNVLHNTDGMYRYATYPQNLFRRYIWLCTKLDGNENIPLDTAPAEPSATVIAGDWKNFDANAPLKYFVKLDNVKSLTSTVISNNMTLAAGEGLSPGVYGTVIAKTGDLDITVSGAAPAENKIPSEAIIGNTFKGVAIINGDITVDTGMNVDGLLLATGKITLKGNNKINYNKGLIQSRIEKEINIIKNDKDATYKDYYLINYLSKDVSGTAKLIYEVTPGSKVKRERIEADYNDFMHYENWQKGAQ